MGLKLATGLQKHQPNCRELLLWIKFLYHFNTCDTKDYL